MNISFTPKFHSPYQWKVQQNISVLQKPIKLNRFAAHPEHKFFKVQSLEQRIHFSQETLNSKVCRKISVTRQSPFATHIGMASLFQSKVQWTTPILVGFPQTRWQHTHASSDQAKSENEKEEESGKTGNGYKTRSENPSNEKSNFEKAFGLILSVAGTGSFATLIGLFMYIWANAPDEKWTQRIKEIMDVMKNGKLGELDEAFKDLKLAQIVLNNMVKLRDSLGGKDFEDIIQKIINGAQEANERKLEANEKKLEAEKIKLKTKYKSEIETLKAEHKKSEAEIKSTQEKRFNEKIESLKSEHTKEMDTQKRSQQYGEEAKSQLSLENGKLKKVINLFQQCQGDQTCFDDLNKFLSEKSMLEFEKHYHFSPKFMSLLSQALQSNLNDSVTTLKLYGTYIKENDGLKILMNGLKHNTTIKSLNLGWTDIDKHDVTVIASMLETNKTIEEIDLYCNKSLDDGDVSRLQEALKGNKTFKRIGLRDTKVSPAKKKELEDNGITVL